MARETRSRRSPGSVLPGLRFVLPADTSAQVVLYLALGLVIDRLSRDEHPTPDLYGSDANDDFE